MHADFKWQHLAICIVGVGGMLWSARVPAQQLRGGQLALHDVAALRAAVARFAGGPARLDDRMVVPRCPSPALSWARADVVRADCADPAWSLYVPVAVPAEAGGRSVAAARPKPMIRRGERVQVEAAGPGFAIAMEAEAERDADGTRVALKSLTGRRFSGRIEEGGRVVLAR
ncbi:hypothetical protein [Sandarakinorhabdus sp.]|uniref:hypothetical protein n=1 Tax=Sandarakinorhabdus sp. TaxID=1916663 RepID=UPI003341B273